MSAAALLRRHAHGWLAEKMRRVAEVAASKVCSRHGWDLGDELRWENAALILLDYYMIAS